MATVIHAGGAMPPAAWTRSITPAGGPQQACNKAGWQHTHPKGSPFARPRAERMASQGEDVPENANSGCVGVTSDTAGKVRPLPVAPARAAPATTFSSAATWRARALFAASAPWAHRRHGWNGRRQGARAARTKPSVRRGRRRRRTQVRGKLASQPPAPGSRLPAAGKISCA
eukprot:COSAG06_NODE_18489_length_885_cov_1.078880_1_plen_172_part_00